MAKPNVKLVTSLAHLEKLQKSGRQVFHSSELKRVHRERLIRTGFLCPVVKGWLILSSPQLKSWRYDTVVFIFLGILFDLLQCTIRR